MPLASLIDPRYRAMVLLAAGCGLRLPAARKPVVAPVLVAAARWSNGNHGERSRRNRAGDDGTAERARRAVRGAVRLRAGAIGRADRGQRDRVDQPRRAPVRYPGPSWPSP